MKKLFISLFILSGMALGAVPIPDDGAKAVLQKYAEAGKNRTPRSGRTAIFARAQLKYGLERSDYLHRWTDFPLLQDTGLKQYTDGSFINPEAWKIMAATIKDYNIDGFAFFPITKRRPDLFKKAVTAGHEVTILPELTKGAGLDKIAPLLEMALANPNVYRIDGKIVITTYSGASQPDFWLKLKHDMTAKYGDKFLLMPMHTLPNRLVGTNVQKLTAKGVKELADTIREWLRHFDGYYYNHPPLNQFRRYDAAFDRDVMIPLLTGILAEPEFRNKYLAWGTKVGHENYYQKGSFTYNCGGTSMLRGSVGSAVAAKADVINLVEWDEENENTSFRPTLANSFSTKRIMRYLAGISKGQLPEPLAGDDLTIPDLILSYRRTLVAGETVTFEVVNVPGKNQPAAELPVQLTLKNPDGKTVKIFTGTVNTAKLDELRFDVKVADVLDHHTLIPELTVKGKTYTGFIPVELRANYNADNKWVKQPLRDLAKCTATVTVTETLPDGKVKISGKITSETPLHHVALIDSGSWAYIHNTPEEFHETADRVVIKLIIVAKPRAGIALHGNIRIRNAKNLVCAEYGGRGKSYVIAKADGWDLPGGIFPSNFNALQLICSMDRASAANAVFEVKVGAQAPKFYSYIFNGKISAAEIMAKNLYAVAGKGMSMMVFHHNDQPTALPERIGKKEVSFSLIRQPSFPQSLFFIEAIDVNGKTFRSAPATIYRPSGEKAEFSAYDFFGKKPVKVVCDRNLLTVQKVEFSDRYGAAVKNSGGNDLTGIAGNTAAFANVLRMMAESAYGSLVIWQQRKLADDLVSAPQLITRADGKFAWRFAGQQNISFPVDTIFPYSGFELTMDVAPDALKGTQTLLSSGHAGFNLELRNGVPVASFYRANVPRRNTVAAKGAKLVAGKTSRITVKFDQQTLQVVVNGVPGTAVKCSGYQLYPQAVSVGYGLKGNGFKGEISALEIKPL